LLPNGYTLLPTTLLIAPTLQWSESGVNPLTITPLIAYLPITALRVRELPSG